MFGRLSENDLDEGRYKYIYIYNLVLKNQKKNGEIGDDSISNFSE